MPDSLEHQVPASLPYLRIPEYIPQKNLVGFWPFFKRRGTLLDYSGEGNDGTINGATWTWNPDKSKPVLSFDGSDDYVDLPNYPTLSSFTICYWAKMSSGAKTFKLDANQGTRLEFDAYYAGALDFATREAGSWTHLQVSPSGITGELHHFAVVWKDDTNKEGFFDGSSYNSTTPGTQDDIDGDDTIACPSGLVPAGFDGSEFLLFNRTLSASEIANIYEKTRP